MNSCGPRQQNNESVTDKIGQTLHDSQSACSEARSFKPGKRDYWLAAKIKYSQRIKDWGSCTHNAHIPIRSYVFLHITYMFQMPALFRWGTTFYGTIPRRIVGCCYCCPQPTSVDRECQPLWQMARFRFVLQEGHIETDHLQTWLGSLAEVFLLTVLVRLLIFFVVL